MLIDEGLPPISEIIAAIDAALARPAGARLTVASRAHADSAREALWICAYKELPGIMHTQAFLRREN